MDQRRLAKKKKLRIISDDCDVNAKTYCFLCDQLGEKDEKSHVRKGFPPSTITALSRYKKPFGNHFLHLPDIDQSITLDIDEVNDPFHFSITQETSVIVRGPI